MRILMTSTGHAGHVMPLVPFARALIRAGHELRVAAPRSRHAIMERADLPFVPFGDPPEDESLSIFRSTEDVDPEEANRIVIGEVFGRIDTRAALPGVLAIVDRWRPDAIVRESYEFASAIAAELRGIPHVRVATGLASTEDWLLGLAAARVDEARVEAGLPADPGADRIRTSPYLTLTPPALDGPARIHAFREVETGPSPSGDSSGAASPDSWGGRDQPLVYVSFGSVAGALSFYPGLYRAAVDALADLPVRVLVTIGEAGDPADLGPLPPNARVERWVPQGDVLPKAAAVVSHGGYGSTIGALSHGVPMVVAPLFADQMRNADRVVEAGAGIALPAFASFRRAWEDGPAALGALGDLVRRVLDDPQYRRAAGRVAASAASAPAVDHAVDLLEAIARPAPATAGGRAARRWRPVPAAAATRA
jgi:UDP:flavonoid glycosyltransferase YjiC (YdhE family)